MSSNVFAQPLRLNIEPSRCIRRIQAWAYIAAALALGVAAYRLDAPWNYIVAALIPALALALRYAYTRRSGRRWVKLVWMPSDALRLRSASGEERAAYLDTGSFVSPRLIVLALRIANRRTHLAICHDAVGADEHRRLRVKLRSGVATEEDP